MDDSLDLKQFFGVLRKHLAVIMVFAFLAGAAGFCGAKFLVPKKYESSAMLYVENNQNSSDTVNINDITAAQKLVNTCQILFQSNSMLENVIFELDLPYSMKELQKMISVTSVNSTEVMRITASSNDPQEAADIVNVLVELAESEFKRIIKSGSIEVVEYGQVPEVPSFPSVIMFTAAGLLIGGILSYVVLFLKEILDVTIKPSDDIAKIYSIPVFAEIMDFEAREKGSGYSDYGGYGSRSGEKSKAPKKRSSASKRYLLGEDTPFSIAEAYRGARTNLIFSLAAAEGNVVSFTSSEPGEGKSTTCVNMSIAFADMGKRVLLIDCDMRKPTVHTAFKIITQKGLSSVLGGFCKLEDAVVKNVRTSLDVIPSGPIPPNPTELLGSKVMAKLIEKASAEYDYVMIDTPPINVVTDSQLMNSLIGGHVFIVRENVTSHPNVGEALEKVNLANGKVLGFVKVCCGGSGGRYKRGKYSYGYNSYGYGGYDTAAHPDNNQ